MTISKTLRQKGAPNDNQDPDLDQFLSSNTNYYEQSASGVGYQGARWDDNAGTHSWGQGIDGADDNANFLRPSDYQENHYDYPHQQLSGLLDDQADLPAGKLLGGGGPVSDNKQGGVGPGKPRFAPKLSGGAASQNNRDARGGRNGRR